MDSRRFGLYFHQRKTTESRKITHSKIIFSLCLVDLSLTRPRSSSVDLAQTYPHSSSMLNNLPRQSLVGTYQEVKTHLTDSPQKLQKIFRKAYMNNEPNEGVTR